MLKKIVNVSLLVIMYTFSLNAQCRGFEMKVDPFRNEKQMNTLWITNSVKIKSPKVKYRLDFKDGESYLLFHFFVVNKVSILKNDELIFLNNLGETITLKVNSDVEPEEAGIAGVKGYNINVKFLITEEQLTQWTNSFMQARIYFQDRHITFPFDHRKNYQLFHDAKKCYVNELEGI